MSKRNGKQEGTGSSRRRTSIHPYTSRLLRNSKERPASGLPSIFSWPPSRRVLSREGSENQKESYGLRKSFSSLRSWSPITTSWNARNGYSRRQRKVV